MSTTSMLHLCLCGAPQAENVGNRVPFATRKLMTLKVRGILSFAKNSA